MGVKCGELPHLLSNRVLEFYKTNVKSIKPYDRSGVLSRLPIDLRTQILNHLYLPTIEVRPALL
jgi:hypothetical protein